MNIEYDFSDKNEMLDKLRAYATNPDDDNIRIKEKIKDTFKHCPELLYALNNKALESELFKSDGSLNVDEDGEPLGEWDRYFGENSNIRPFLFIPQVQDTVQNFISYTTFMDETARYNNAVKVMTVTFTIMVEGHNAMDKLTGIARHDLIASIIREKFAWIGVEINTPVPVYDKETVSDNSFVVRTLRFEMTLPNSLVKTTNGITAYSNKMW